MLNREVNHDPRHDVHAPAHLSGAAEMIADAIGWICATVFLILTLGSPDILDGLIKMANGCAP